MKAYLPHPLSETFPAMADAEFQALKDDIKANGQATPIVLHEGKILDGRHRYKACTELDKQPIFEEFKGEDALSYIISTNLHRRHLSISQRAAISLTLYDKLSAEKISKRHTSEYIESLETCDKTKKQRLTANVVGKIFGVGRCSVGNAATIRRYCPQLIPKIINGELTIGQCRKLMPNLRPDKKKVKPPLKNVSDEQAAEILRSISEVKTDLGVPNSFDSMQDYLSKHIPALNDAGYVLQMVFCNRKIHAQVIRFNERFDNWGNQPMEFEFRRAVSVAWREKLGKVNKKAA